MKNDFKYIFKRVLIGLLLFLIISFIKSCQVHAEVKPIVNSGSNTRYYPSGTNNISFNNWYTTNTDTSLSEIYFELETGYTNDGYGGQIQDTIYAGQYLFDFYVETNNLTTHLASCNGSNSDFSFIDITSGNRITSSQYSKSQCIDSYYTIIGGNRAIHYLYSWTITNNSNYEYMTNDIRLIVRNWTGTGYTTNNASYLILVGNLQDYNPVIVQNFTNVADQQRLNQESILNATQNAQNIINNQNQNTQDILNSQSIINQNINNIGQDTSVIIQQNNDINNSINDVNDSINDSSTASNQDFNDAISSVTNALPTNSTISSLVTMPITFLQKIIDALGGSCSPIVIGELYEYNMTMPCINISTYIGSIYNIIDVICAGFFAYYFGKKLVVIFHNITSMKEGGLKEAYD